MEANGIHCIAELYDCPAGLLNDESAVVRIVRQAVNQGMATLLGEVSHHFHPQGVTALALIAESHIAVHTWPECGYVAADVFTCGDRASAEKACDYLVQAFRARRHSVRKLVRGIEVTSPASIDEPVGRARQPISPALR